MHWREHRARLVRELRTDLGFLKYAQLHQLSRLNPIYLGIRASRSSVVTGVLSFLRGRKDARSKPDRHTQREERWDVTDEFWYPSREALVHAVTSGRGRDAARRLIEDHVSRVRRTAVITAEEFVAAAAPTGGLPRIRVMFCLRSPPSLGREKMLAHWGASHKELVLSLQGALKYRLYDQLHVRSGPELSEVVEVFGGSSGQEFDGVAGLSYRGQADLLLGFLNPRTQLANLKLVKDEITFIDGRRSALVYGEHYLIEG